MSESKHTPLPWIVGSFSAVTGDAVQYIQTLGHGKQPTHVSECHSGRAGDASREEREVNAAFIVRACNAHDDLLATLKAVLDCFWDGRSKQNVKRDYHLVKSGRAAIAKAEGRTE